MNQGQSLVDAANPVYAALVALKDSTAAAPSPSRAVHRPGAYILGTSWTAPRDPPPRAPTLWALEALEAVRKRARVTRDPTPPAG